MKLTKIILTGVVAAALMSTSCSSDSNDDMEGTDMTIDTIHVDGESEHPSNSEHPANSEHPENAEHPNDGAEHPASSDEHPSADSETTTVVSREEVKLALLPPSVTEILKSQDYLKYKTERAYLVTHKNGIKTYEINVKEGDISSTLVFNEKGERVVKK